MRQNDIHDGGVFAQFTIYSVLAMVLTVVINLGLLVAVCFIIYFFLAAAGVVPPLDLIPFVPYI